MTGGTSMLQGAAELGEDIFFRQVRIANPKYEGNLGFNFEPALLHGYWFDH